MPHPFARRPGRTPRPRPRAGRWAPLFLLLLSLVVAGETISRQELLRTVWGHRGAVLTHTVDSHISELRHKREDDPESPRHIHTVWKAGYRFQRKGAGTRGRTPHAVCWLAFCNRVPSWNGTPYPTRSALASTTCSATRNGLPGSAPPRCSTHPPRKRSIG